MSLVFAIDTTSPFCSVSILKNGEIISEYNFFSQGELSSSLIPIVENIFSLYKIKVPDIDLVGVVTGPGHFTGIRVGLSTVKGMFFGENIAFVPVNSLEVTANKIVSENILIVPLLDARRGEVYTAVYKRNKDGMSALKTPTLLKISGLKEFLKTDDSVVFCGNGISVYKELLKNDFPECKFIERSPFNSSEAGKIALVEFEKKNYFKNIDKLEPLYIRIPDAEKTFNSGKG